MIYAHGDPDGYVSVRLTQQQWYALENLIRDHHGRIAIEVTPRPQRLFVYCGYRKSSRVECYQISQAGRIRIATIP